MPTMETQAHAADKGKGKGGIPTWVYLAGGGVIALFVLMQKSSGGGAAAPDNSGLLAAEVAQTLAEQKQSVQEQLAASREELANALADATAKQEAAGVKQAAETQTLLSGFREQLSGLAAAIAKLGENKPPAPAPEQGKPPAPIGMTGPTGNEIASWSSAIGLPNEFGEAFVQRFGRLPSSIPELEAWRPYVLAQNAEGKWCTISGWPCVG